MPSRKAKGRNISHELKTPLAAIEGYALLLEEGGSSPELKEYARKISESSRQLSHMTGNILQNVKNDLKQAEQKTKNAAENAEKNVKKDLKQADKKLLQTGKDIEQGTKKEINKLKDNTKKQ